MLRPRWQGCALGRGARWAFSTAAAGCHGRFDLLPIGIEGCLLRAAGAQVVPGLERCEGRQRSNKVRSNRTHRVFPELRRGQRGGLIDRGTHHFLRGFQTGGLNNALIEKIVDDFPGGCAVQLLERRTNKGYFLNQTRRILRPPQRAADRREGRINPCILDVVQHALCLDRIERRALVQRLLGRTLKNRVALQVEQPLGEREQGKLRRHRHAGNGAVVLRLATATVYRVFRNGAGRSH